MLSLSLGSVASAVLSSFGGYSTERVYIIKAIPSIPLGIDLRKCTDISIEKRWNIKEVNGLTYHAIVTP